MGISEYIALASFLFNVILVIVGMKVKAEIADAKVTMERKVEVGQSDIRTEMKQVELYMRDNFVRKSSFDKIVDMMTTQMQVQFERLQGSIDRLNDKIDKFNQT